MYHHKAGKQDKWVECWTLLTCMLQISQAHLQRHKFLEGHMKWGRHRFEDQICCHWWEMALLGICKKTTKQDSLKYNYHACIILFITFPYYSVWRPNWICILLIKLIKGLYLWTMTGLFLGIWLHLWITRIPIPLADAGCNLRKFLMTLIHTYMYVIWCQIVAFCIEKLGYT